MDARGLVAVIVTVHEVALVLALLLAAFTGLVSLLVFRNQNAGKRNALSLAFAVGVGLLCYGVGARLADVRPLDVEVVRVAG